MARIQYYFDTETSQYKRHHPTKTDRWVNTTGVFILALSLGLIMMLCYNALFETPREMRLGNEVREMEYYYHELELKVAALDKELAAVEDRDDNIYRTVLGSPRIDPSIRLAGHGGSDRYADLKGKNLDAGPMIAAISEKIDHTRRKLYIETTSQDELVELSQKRDRQYAAIPAIQPVSNKTLIGIASGFGLRIHPIYKVIKPHTGIDFAAPPGAVIYATADGKVVAVDTKFDGYGKLIVIDHGFGYVTRYAHLQDFKVQVGQNVKRGEAIGYVGSTGLSTAPHLHYEVIMNGEQIDPVHYFFNDLSPAEYEKVVELASVQNQSLGN